jgi:KaiC/GvpD/RAD55 family RecA-like ATPase
LSTQQALSIASTGISGLDDVLHGGLVTNRLYLVEGTPGTGKTTLALQFLLEGAAQGERGLYITLSETAEELRAVAASHGWSLDGIDVFELASGGDALDPDREQDLLHPWEIELGEVIKAITDEIERLAPRGLPSTASPSCGCSRRTRCGTAGKSSTSSNSWPDAMRRCSCLTTARQ